MKTQLLKHVKIAERNYHTTAKLRWNSYKWLYKDTHLVKVKMAFENNQPNHTIIYNPNLHITIITLLLLL